MAKAIEVGATFTRSFPVDEGRAIDFMGPQIRVYATPSVVLDVEVACRDWLLDHIEAGQDSVGARVDIDHLKPTPLGMSATHSGRVSAVDGRRVAFEVVVRDDVEEVARVRHERVIVDTARLAAFVAAKRARRG